MPGSPLGRSRSASASRVPLRSVTMGRLGRRPGAGPIPSKWRFRACRIIPPRVPRPSRGRGGRDGRCPRRPPRAAPARTSRGSGRGRPPQGRDRGRSPGPASRLIADSVRSASRLSRQPPVPSPSAPETMAPNLGFGHGYLLTAQELLGVDKIDLRFLNGTGLRIGIAPDLAADWRDEAARRNDL